MLRDGHHYVHELGRSGQARYGTAESFARCDSSFHGGCYHGVIQAHFEALTAVDRAGLPSFCRGGVIAATSTALEWECDHGLGTASSDGLLTSRQHYSIRSSATGWGQRCYVG